MSLTRREFLWSTAAAAVLRPEILLGQPAGRAPSQLFRHGVASGDPLADRVILWTRVTPPNGSTRPIEVTWQVGSDPNLSHNIAHGTTHATADRDFTVKVDAGGLTA